MPISHDLVIRNGLMVDGSGHVPYRGDLAVNAGVITNVGLVSGSGHDEIDAEGKIVTPGFVDIHTHYDGQITWENRLSPSSVHGVTTVVMGNCGVGFAPCRRDQHELLIKLMEGVEDIPDIVMEKGVPWTWQTFPEYLNALDQRSGDVDFATQLPHSALRVFVMGERGAAREPATDSDLAEMRRLTAEAISAGALGVSTSRNIHHRFRDGRPAPSVNTEEKELLSLAAGLRDADGGVFQLNPNNDEDAAHEVALIERITEASGRPTSFSLIAIPNKEHSWDTYAEGLNTAVRKNLPIRAQFYPRPIGLLFGLDLSINPFALNPSYKSIAHKSLAERIAIMRDPAFRASVLAEEPQDRNSALIRIVRATQYLYSLGDPPRYNPAPEESFAAQAQLRGIPERELIYDALLEKDGKAILYAIAAPAERYIRRTMALYDRNNALIGLGDGGAHYGLICDAAYPTFVLTQMVREGDLSLATAIANMTCDAALAVGLGDRGLLKPGYKADINVIDLERLKLHAPFMKADLPAGGRRLHQQAEGYAVTVVNGVVTYRQGQATGALPGRLVRGARSAFTMRFPRENR